MKKIILISGKAENGKTTAAMILKKELEELGERVIITRCAYYLKDIATRYCQWDGSKDEKGRELLQQLGTNIIREKLNRPLFHIGRICEDIEIGQDYVDYVIIDDVRFENEIYHPKTIFGDKVYTIRVNRLMEDMITPYRSSLTDAQLLHQSEVGLDNFNEFNKYIFASDVDGLESVINNNLLPELLK